MKKPVYIILIVIAIALMAYNFTMVNFNSPFEGDSTVALIGIMAALCAIVLLLIFLSSKKIENKLNE